MWKEFKEFAVKGNAFDLAIGVIIGVAFGKIVDSIVNDLIMPVIGAVDRRRSISPTISRPCRRPSPPPPWRQPGSRAPCSPTAISSPW